VRTETRAATWSGALACLLAAVVVVATTVGPVSLDAVPVAKALLNQVPVPTGLTLGLTAGAVGPIPYPSPSVDVATTSLFAFQVDRTTSVIVTRVRLPRILLAAIVGLALGTAGTVMQGVFRNPMADPSIIGVSSGAAVGAVATIAVPSLVPVGLQTAAFAGAVVTTFGVYLIAREGGRTPVATLLLAGVAVQTFLGAVTSYLLLHSGESLERAIYWLMGHLHAATMDQVGFTLPWILVGVPVLFAYADDLDVLLLGEEDAHHLGVDVERTRLVTLSVASLVTAAAVAVSGVIGFVGLIVPHVMRLVVGPDHRVLMPTSAFAGATFLVAADTVARSGPAEMPVGIVTAAVGAPFFLFLLRRREVTEL
jgi:iron complex transport system permease protein